MTRTPPPMIEYTPPPCPICRQTLSGSGDLLDCHGCQVSWPASGYGLPVAGVWWDPDAEQCHAEQGPTPHANSPVLRSKQRCVLAHGHGVKHPLFAPQYDTVER